MRLSLFVLFYFALVIPEVGLAQIRCGTVTPKNSREREQNISFRSGSPAVTNCLNKTLSVRFILVMDSLNNTGVSTSDLNSAITVLNSNFSPICLSFAICDVDTVYNYKYNRWSQINEEAEFIVNFVDPEVINVVLVEAILDPANAGGYAPLGNAAFPAPHYDLIVVQKGDINGVLPHEIGHFFGLYHTFETDMGLEFVNGNNCATTGDLLCDTPADINPAPIDPNTCEWIGTNTDPNGDYYTPQIGNMMSYHPGPCGAFITIDQYNRVIYCYTNFRNYLR